MENVEYNQFQLFPEWPDFLIPYEELMAQPKVRIVYHDIDKVDSQLSTGSGSLSVKFHSMYNCCGYFVEHRKYE